MGCGASKQTQQQQPQGKAQQPPEEAYAARDEDEVTEVVNELNPLLLCTLRNVLVITRLQAKFRGRRQRKAMEARKAAAASAAAEGSA